MQCRLLDISKKGNKKSCTLSLLMKHFEKTLSNRDAWLSAAMLTNFRQSCHSALTINVNRPQLVQLLRSRQPRYPVLLALVSPSFFSRCVTLFLVTMHPSFPFLTSSNKRGGGLIGHYAEVIFIPKG